jgi:hypothetical protein
MPRGRKKGTKNKVSKIVKKERRVNIDKKIIKIKDRIGKLEGTFIILDKSPAYYCLVLRHEIKGKDKFKYLFTNNNLEILKIIADKLSEQLKFPYNPTPVASTRVKKEKTSGIEVNHALFKEFNEHLYIHLSFGSIFLFKGNKFHVKRNYEKVDGIEIYKLKSSLSYNKCQDLLNTYSDEVKNKILKEVIRLGDFEDKNSLRIVMNMKPLEMKCIDGKVIQREIGEKNEEKAIDEEVA